MSLFKCLYVLNCISYLNGIVVWSSLFMGQMAIQLSPLEHQLVHFKGG